MSEKKILVPRGMLIAAFDAQLPVDRPTFGWDETDEHTSQFYIRILTAALRWLSENPIVPTLKEHDDFWKKWHNDISPSKGSYSAAFAREWQRRMFLAPKPEVRPAKTFTAEEIEHSLRESYKGGDYDADWVWRKMQIYLDVAPGPEVPAEIKDLMWNETPEDRNLPKEEGAGVNARKFHNKQLIEAYRRGQKAGNR